MRLSCLIVALLCRSALAQQPQTSQPISVGIVFDASGSMGPKLQQARQLVAEFVKTASPQDEFFVIQFGDRPALLSSFTSNADEIQNQVNLTQSKGKSALFDAINVALPEMKKARNSRKVLLVISDGGDNASRSTAGEIKTLVHEADVQIYAIGILSVRERTVEELSGPGQLHEIAEQSGGRSFAVERSAEIPYVIAHLRIALK